MPESSPRLTISQKANLYFGLSLDLVGLMFLSRLVVDTSNRIFMPFIPQVASGLRLSVAVFSWILAIRSLAGLLSPLVGSLADRFGRRLVMSSTLGIRGLALLGFALSSGWWSVAPLLVLSLTTASYMPVQRAYISDLVRPERRGRALAAIDASFSTAGILGLPAIGWILENWGWQTPFLILAGLNLVTAVVIALRVQKAPLRTTAGRVFTPMKELVRQPKVNASILVSGLMLVIFILFMISWSYLLSERFGFTPAQIGVMGTVIGLAELAGLILAGAFIDRIGKRRGSLIGLAVTAAAFLVFPAFQGSLIVIQVALILLTVAIEFSITATIPLFADQVIQYRATLFCLLSFGSTIGGGLAPPLTTLLWNWKGTSGVYAAGTLLTLLSGWLVWKYLYDSPDEGEYLGGLQR